MSIQIVYTFFGRHCVLFVQNTLEQGSSTVRPRILRFHSEGFWGARENFGIFVSSFCVYFFNYPYVTLSVSWYSRCENKVV